MGATFDNSTDQFGRPRGWVTKNPTPILIGSYDVPGDIDPKEIKNHQAMKPTINDFFKGVFRINLPLVCEESNQIENTAEIDALTFTGKRKSIKIPILCDRKQAEEPKYSTTG